ncbi:ATP-grasp domain-containing protein [Litchfieldia alkalitelluris]|uniref:ATP-grasp domain-containing protein n=1 Tax=Litchfieldia alkalitelluris TaxID=304268 RepID=UPI000996BE84|nr:ATP-grasp domain-containing protein [Litchfieldia alkalitelluris]
METIIFIGVNKSGSSREAIKAAERLGYYTVLFTNRKKQLIQREQYPDVHQMILTDTVDLLEMKKHLKTLQQRGHEICLITSFVDQNVHTATILADEYCQNVLSKKAIEIMENKEQTRTFFEEESFTPNFVLLSPIQNVDTIFLHNKLSFPLMLKSPKSGGSKDAILVENMEQLRYEVKGLRELYPEETFIIEEFIVGDQYLVEAIVYQSRIIPIAVIEQEITKGMRFIVTGYGVMSEIPIHIEREVTKVVKGVVNKLEIKNGGLHLEMRLTEQGMKLIEVNPRISGGAMNDMLEAAFGFSLVEETLKLYLGQAPALTKRRNLAVYTKYVIIPNHGILKKVTGKGRAKHSIGVVKVYVKPKKGTFLHPPLSMGHRYAYVIASAQSLVEAEKLAVQGANEIEFHLEKDETPLKGLDVEHKYAQLQTNEIRSKEE